MYDGMQCDPIQGEGQGRKTFKVINLAIFKSRHLQWELATDHGFLNYGTISKFDRAGFLIFGLVFVSRDFEVRRNVSCQESTISPVQGKFIFNLAPIISLGSVKLSTSNVVC